MRRVSRALLLLLCLSRLVCAEQVTLHWHYPREVEPTGFLLTMSDGATTDQMTVAPSPPDACAALPGAGPDSYCAQWPTCPPPGAYVFLVQAQKGDAVSPATSAPMCAITASCTACESLTPGQGTGPVTGGGTPGTGSQGPTQTGGSAPGGGGSAPGGGMVPPPVLVAWPPVKAAGT